MRFLIFLLFLFMVACTSQPTHQSANSTSDSSSLVKKKPATVLEPLSQRGTFRVKFPLQATSVSFKGFLSGQNDKQVYILNVQKGQQLNGEIRTDSSMANVRFNQIIAPSGAADGPFGNTMEYPFSESGDYQLIIAESLMADAWRGSYKVNLEIIPNAHRFSKLPLSSQ